MFDNVKNINVIDNEEIDSRALSSWCGEGRLSPVPAPLPVLECRMRNMC